MRPRSITGPIILVVIGVLFLINNLWRDVPFWALFADYWPLLVIAIGVIGLVEVLFHASRGATSPSSSALRVRGLFLDPDADHVCGLGSTRNGIHIGRFDAGGINILGTDYEYDVNANGASQGVARVVLDNIRAAFRSRAKTPRAAR